MQRRRQSPECAAGLQSPWNSHSDGTLGTRVEQSLDIPGTPHHLLYLLPALRADQVYASTPLCSRKQRHKNGTGSPLYSRHPNTMALHYLPPPCPLLMRSYSQKGFRGLCCCSLILLTRGLSSKPECGPTQLSFLSKDMIGPSFIGSHPCFCHDMTGKPAGPTLELSQCRFCGLQGCEFEKPFFFIKVATSGMSLE